MLQLTCTGTVEAGACIGKKVLEDFIIRLHVWTRHDLVSAGGYSTVRLRCPHLSHTFHDLNCDLLVSGCCERLRIDEWRICHAGG
jgi:hypothetical protein